MIDKFYEFMIERENIRLRRGEGLPQDQWTQDPVLKVNKFTNVKREHDRTTRELVRDFYQDNLARTSRDTLLGNCAIARLFGRSSTVVEIGWVDHWGTDAMRRIDAVCDRRKNDREPIFTGAYIIPNCGDMSPKTDVVIKIIDQFWEAIASRGTSAFDRWQYLTQYLCSQVRGVGSFIAKEVLLDYILVSGWIPEDWTTWTPVGPGARRGAKRVMNAGNPLPVPSEKLALEWIRQIYDRREAYWPTDFVSLDLTDIQFQCCEFDKYLRVKQGEAKKTKNLFRPTRET